MLMLFSSVHRVSAEVLQGLLLEGLYLLEDTVQVILTLLPVFALNERQAALSSRSEPGEQKGKCRILKKPLLRLFRIFVHCVTNQGEVDPSSIGVV